MGPFFEISMLRVRLAIALAWAFLWRFFIVAALQMYAQYRAIIYMKFIEYNSSWHIVSIFIMLSLFAFLPFFLTIYWLLVGGRLYKITMKYDDTREHRRIWFMRFFDYIFALMKKIISMRRNIKK